MINYEKNKTIILGLILTIIISGVFLRDYLEKEEEDDEISSILEVNKGVTNLPKYNISLYGELGYHPSLVAIGGESDPAGYILLQTNQSDDLFKNRIYLDFSQIEKYNISNNDI